MGKNPGRKYSVLTPEERRHCEQLFEKELDKVAKLGLVEIEPTPSGDMVRLCTIPLIGAAYLRLGKSQVLADEGIKNRRNKAAAVSREKLRRAG